MLWEESTFAMSEGKKPDDRENVLTNKTLKVMKTMNWKSLMLVALLTVSAAAFGKNDKKYDFKGETKTEYNHKYYGHKHHKGGKKCLCLYCKKHTKHGKGCNCHKKHCKHAKMGYIHSGRR